MIGALFAEELVLHLFKFDGAEDEVAGGDLVAEGLSHLGDPEGYARAGGPLDVQEIDKFPLRGFRAQIDFVLPLFGHPAGSLEHHVELADGGEVGFSALRTANLVLPDILLHLLVGHGIGVDRPLGMAFNERIRAVAGLALPTVHFGVGKGRRVPGSVPHARVHQNGCVHPEGVFAFLHKLFPPGALDVVFDLHADRAVVPGISHAAVNFAARIDNAAAFTEVDEFFHCGFLFSHGVPLIFLFSEYYSPGTGRKSTKRGGNCKNILQLLVQRQNV